MMETIDRRVLAGFRCVDAITGSSILSPLAVTGTPLAIKANRSGVFAVLDGPGLTPLTTQFVPSAPNSWPAPATYEITITDPAMQYLARRAYIAAPQPLPVLTPPATTAPPAAGTTTTPQLPPPPPVTTPQQVVLYPTTAAPLAPNWAVIRVLVTNNATPPAPLPWAVIQVTGAGSPAPAGLTNQNGEALLAVLGLGLKLSSSGTGSVTETTTAATVTAWFDPGSLGQAAGWVPNPDDILWNLSDPQWKSASQAVQLGPGQTVNVSIAISM